jgi:hypothetical protein
MFDQLETGRPRLSAPMTLMAMSVIGLFVTCVICVIPVAGTGVFIGLHSALGLIALRVSVSGMIVSVLWLVVARIIRALRR